MMEDLIIVSSMLDTNSVLITILFIALVSCSIIAFLNWFCLIFLLVWYISLRIRGQINYAVSITSFKFFSILIATALASIVVYFLYTSMAKIEISNCTLARDTVSYYENNPKLKVKSVNFENRLSKVKEVVKECKGV